MILSMLLVLSGCKSHPPIRMICIGIVTTMDNDTSLRYLDSQRGATLAIEEWNLKGGPLGLLVREKNVDSSHPSSVKQENQTSRMMAYILADNSREAISKSTTVLQQKIPIFGVGNSTATPIERNSNLFVWSLDSNHSYQQDSVFQMFRNKYQKRFLAKETSQDAYLAYLSVDLTLNAIVSRVSMDNQVILEEIRMEFSRKQGIPSDDIKK
jgi:hypothetical protein